MSFFWCDKCRSSYLWYQEFNIFDSMREYVDLICLATVYWFWGTSDKFCVESFDTVLKSYKEFSFSFSNKIRSKEVSFVPQFLQISTKVIGIPRFSIDKFCIFFIWSLIKNIFLCFLRIWKILRESSNSVFVYSFYAILKREANTYYHEHESITWRFLIKWIIGFVKLTITGPILSNRTKIRKLAWYSISERGSIIAIGIHYIPFWVGENRTSFISAIVWKLRCKFLRYCIVGSIFFWELKRVAFITF